MYNKYIAALDYDEYKPNFSLRTIERLFKRVYQKLTCGGCCSEDCWDLDNTLIEKLYTWLMIYYIDADRFIELHDDYHTVIWQGRKFYQDEAIIYILATLEGYLVYINDSDNDFNLEFYWMRQVEDAFGLLSKILFMLWW